MKMHMYIYIIIHHSNVKIILFGSYALIIIENKITLDEIRNEPK